MGARNRIGIRENSDLVRGTLRGGTGWSFVSGFEEGKTLARLAALNSQKNCSNSPLIAGEKLSNMWKLTAGCSAVGSALHWGCRGRWFKSSQPD